MTDGESNAGKLGELDFMEMVSTRWTGDEAELALPALEKARDGFVEGRDYHFGIGEMCQQRVDILDTLIAAATDLKQRRVVQDVVPPAPEVDLSQIRYGNATGADIVDCRKYRHALWPIARRNNGVVDLGKAAALIVAVMKPHGDHDSMKAGLGKFVRSDPRWERVSRGQYRLLEMEASEDENHPDEIPERRAGEGPALKAA